MRKFISYILIGILVVSMFGCGDTSVSAERENDKKVTAFPTEAVDVNTSDKEEIHETPNPIQSEENEKDENNISSEDIQSPEKGNDMAEPSGEPEIKDVAKVNEDMIYSLSDESEVVLGLYTDGTASIVSSRGLTPNMTEYGKYEIDENEIKVQFDECEEIILEKNGDDLVYNEFGKVNKSGRISESVTLTDGAVFKGGLQSKWGIVDFEDAVIATIEYTSHVVRTNGYVNGAKYPQTCFITNRSELDAYYNEKNGRYDLSEKMTSDSVKPAGFMGICKSYDDTFFETHILALILIESGTGSAKYNVTGIRKKEADMGSVKNILTVDIEVDVPEVVTDDMAEWHIIIELPNDISPDEYMIHPSMYEKGKKSTKLGKTVVKKPLAEVKMDTVKDVKVPAIYTLKGPGAVYGTKEHFTYESKTTGTTRGANILLPGDYDPAKEYPVLYFLHGIFGDENAIINDNNNKIVEIMGNLKYVGYIDDVIIVFPNMFAASDPKAVPSFSIEGTAPYDNFINDLTNDLIPYVEEHYSVKKDRKYRAIIGFSLGGRESLFIGTRRSDLFCCSGAISPAPGLTPGKDWAMEHPGQLREEELVVVQQDEYPLDLIMICCGTVDKVVGKFPESYHNILTTNGVDHIWYEIPGADHDNTAIASGFYNFLLRWGKNMK